ARQAAAAFEMARQAGFDNVSGDIMLALPHYSREEFDETLALIQEGGAAHISAYLLKIEPGSAFGRQPPAGLPDADQAAGFYLYAVERLAAAGYRQYEISSFARPGREGRHNRIYWDCGDYLGLGPAAHSCLAGKRFYYPADTAAFVAGTARPVPDGGCGAEDYLILQLRLASGLDLAEYRRRGGPDFTPRQRAFLAHCQQARSEEHTSELQSRVPLTRPSSGLVRANAFIPPPTPPLSWPGRPVRCPTGAAAPRITSSSSCGWPAGWTWRNTAAGAGRTSPPGSVPSWPTASR